MHLDSGYLATMGSSCSLSRISKHLPSQHGSFIVAPDFSHSMLFSVSCTNMYSVRISCFESTRTSTILARVNIIILQVSGLNVTLSAITLQVQCVADQTFPLISNLGQTSRNVLLSLRMEIWNNYTHIPNFVYCLPRVWPFCVLLYALYWYALCTHFVFWKYFGSIGMNRLLHLASVWSRCVWPHFDAVGKACRISSISTDARPLPSHAKWIPLVARDNLQFLQ